MHTHPHLLHAPLRESLKLAPERQVLPVSLDLGFTSDASSSVFWATVRPGLPTFSRCDIFSFLKKGD